MPVGQRVPFLARIEQPRFDPRRPGAVPGTGPVTLEPVEPVGEISTLTMPIELGGTLTGDGEEPS